jgi:hypothetical protein
MICIWLIHFNLIINFWWFVPCLLETVRSVTEFRYFLGLVDYQSPESTQYLSSPWIPPNLPVHLGSRPVQISCLCPVQTQSGLSSPDCT